ncbi:hypothetical protein DVR12_19985 [Chitinophaga silvatica]|uniref:Terpene synthase n=1 Tax=Chitinophaga silvatica TaxID=2282649 RepID=A0A3E1Y5J4_9BACT|nr:terpene synthase family protein [Chitinophaga silvatica]RFS20008.1 hypothetical protein DVR12_19985 [Chitinophaga silvatica]
MSIKSTSVAEPLKNLQEDYQALVNAGFSCSIAAFINDRRYPLKQYCKPFSPHPRSEEIISVARLFCKEHGIWLDNAQHYITCQLFLYPSASFERILVMTKNNAIDYYLNDTMGRDLFKNLSASERESAAQIIKRMASLDTSLTLQPESELIEEANVKMLREIQKNSSEGWFSKFLEMYNYHIEITHRNCNSSALGFQPTVAEYIDMRYHTSGMPHIVLLLEYAENNFLDWEWMETNGIASSLERVHWLIAAFGCLSNDIFSFEKEVIDENTDANLLAVIAINEPSWQLREVIFHATTIVRRILTEYFEKIQFLRVQISNLESINIEKARGLMQHLESIERCVQASWMWQVYTKRYKRSNSIWDETQLFDTTISKAV